MKTAAIFCVALCLLLLVGCESAPKPNAAVAGRKLTYWEYRDLAGVNVETDPQAQKLLHDGWLFTGYSLPYPRENYRVDFPAGYPVVMGYPGPYSSGTNSFTTVAHFRRVTKVVKAQ
jgi:hypothetical protein